MARRKPVKKKEEPGLTAQQFTRRQMLKKLGIGLGALSLGILGREVVKSHKRGKILNAELKELERQRKVRDIEYKKISAERKAKHRAEWDAHRKKFYEKHELKNNIQKAPYKKAVPFLREHRKELRQEYLNNRLTPTQIAANKRKYSILIDVECAKAGLNGKVNHRTVKQLIQNESMWDPKAVSSTNDFGLCQMNFSVFDSMWTSNYHHNPMNPEETIHTTVKYLKDLQKKYGDDPTKVLTAYNMGEPVVDASVKQFGSSWQSKGVVSTNNYASRVLKQRI